MTTILIVGGADTGRSPMTAALLQRRLAARGYACAVESAGVLGHDGDPAEAEARDTMMHMGLDISTHAARSLSAELVEQAALLLALDRGVAMVVRSRFSGADGRLHILGDLAGRPRDVPDPSKMQIGAWMMYAREIDALLEAALPRIIVLLQDQLGEGQLVSSEETRVQDGTRVDAVERLERVLRLAIDMPGVVDWSAAHTQIEAELPQINAPYSHEDLVHAYVGLIRAALALTPTTPSPGQLAALRDAISRANGPITQTDLNEFSAHLGRWPGL